MDHQALQGHLIRDADGWRRDGVDFDTPITESDYERRYAMSTVDHRGAPPAVKTCSGGEVAVDHNGDPCCRLCGWNQPPPGHRGGVTGQIAFAALVMQPHPDFGHPENAMYRPEGGRL